MSALHHALALPEVKDVIAKWITDLPSSIHEIAITFSEALYHRCDGTAAATGRQEEQCCSSGESNVSIVSGLKQGELRGKVFSSS
jgi:hypothetical protein